MQQAHKNLANKGGESKSLQDRNCLVYLGTNWLTEQTMPQKPSDSKPLEENNAMEAKVNPDGMRDSVMAWRMHQIREGQVCRLEIPTENRNKPSLGTGFLIGPDTVSHPIGTW